MSNSTHTSAAQRTIFGVVAWTIVVYSMAGHKEWRFIHPLLPLFHVFAAKSLVELHHAASPKPAVVDNIKPSHAFPIRTKHLCLLLLGIPASVYVVAFYCSAPISVISYLRNLPSTELEQSVGFLMPCHSTPWQAYLHRPVADNRIWALGCEPPLRNENLASYRDQTDVFYHSPQAYLRHHFPAKVDLSFPPSPFPKSIPGVLEQGDDVWEHRWPKYIVLFGVLLHEDGVRNLLKERGYSEVWKRGRSWEGDERRKGGVRVWKHLGRTL